MAASGSMMSAMSSLWLNGGTAQLVNLWFHCSGPQPGPPSSVYSMEPPTSTYGTCWKTTQSPWSQKGSILTGRIREDISSVVFLPQLFCNVLYTFCCLPRVMAMGVFGDSGQQKAYSGIALAHESGSIAMQSFTRDFTVPVTAEAEKLESLMTEAFWNTVSRIAAVRVLFPYLFKGVAAFL